MKLYKNRETGEEISENEYNWLAHQKQADMMENMNAWRAWLEGQTSVWVYEQGANGVDIAWEEACEAKAQDALTLIYEENESLPLDELGVAQIAQTCQDGKTALFNHCRCEQCALRDYCENNP